MSLNYCWLKEKNGKYGVIDKTGKVVIPFEYGYPIPTENRLFRIELNGKYGVMSYDGKLLIPIQYDYIYDFFNNIAKVSLDGETFYIDKQGNRLD